ncbi:MAG TPA: helix-turn-helix domain-containing protein [Streptosporangiaceae bacterium]|nr:helix-turn-helix domain-containing protein [Streptosporangiaceae bacterium]
MKPDNTAQCAAAALELLTVAEVAEWLRVEPRYVYRLASSGELVRVYVGRYVRIPATSVEQYIDDHTVEAVKPARHRRPGARARRHLRSVRHAEQ